MLYSAQIENLSVIGQGADTTLPVSKSDRALLCGMTDPFVRLNGHLGRIPRNAQPGVLHFRRMVDKE